jgi:hypothetical protein
MRRAARLPVHRRRPAGVNQNARCAIAWRAGRDPLPSLRQVASRFPLRALCVQTGGHDSREVGLTDRCRFGLIFVLANTGALQPGLGTVLRVFGVAAFVAVLVALRRPAAVTRPAGSGIGRGYWLVVSCEVVHHHGGASPTQRSPARAAGSRVLDLIRGGSSFHRPVGGVLPGALLLAFSLWGSTRGADSDATRTPTS